MLNTSFTDNSVERFSVTDYVIFALSLVLNGAIGIYYACSGGKQKTISEFLFGNKNMGVFPVTMSIVASGTSATGILGIAAEVYTYGIIPLFWNIGLIISCYLAATFYLPVYYKLQLVSVNEYLEKRFNAFVRRALTVITMLSGILLSSLMLYAPALTLSHATGISMTGSVLGSGLVCSLYTIIGGIKAVLWTDTFQQLLVYIGLIAVVIKGFMLSGGIEEMWNIAAEGQRTNILIIDPDPTITYTLWSVIIGGSIYILPMFACAQGIVQRYLSVGSLQKAKKAIYLTIPFFLFNTLLFILCGLVVYARYARCDPVLTNKIYQYEQILPLFVIETMIDTPGISGLFVAAMFGSSLSTITTIWNSSAALILEDLLKPILDFTTKGKVKINENAGANISKIIVAIVVVLTIGIVFIVPYLGRTLFQVTIVFFSITFSPVLGLFTLGLFFPFITSLGATVGCIAGMILISWITLGGGGRQATNFLSVRTDGCSWNNESLFSNVSSIFSQSQFFNNQTILTNEPLERSFLHYVYQLSPMYYVIVGFICTLLIGIITDSIFGFNKGKDVDAQLVYPIANDICCCLTKNCRKILQCGVQYNQCEKITLENHNNYVKKCMIEKETVL